MRLYAASGCCGDGLGAAVALLPKSFELVFRYTDAPEDRYLIKAAFPDCLVNGLLGDFQPTRDFLYG